MTEFNDLRREYLHGELDIKDLLSDPISQFRKWIDEAKNAKIDLPDAMVLSTVLNNRPSSRVVALRGLDEGFVFFTNYNSRKGREIESNENVALNFYWSSFDRQIRIVGKAHKIGQLESQEYFKTRSRASNLAAFSSPQSSVVDSRDVLEGNYKKLEENLDGKDFDCPDYWGGYRVTPEEVEFWQGRENRLHDRFLYRREGNSWIINRLAP